MLVNKNQHIKEAFLHDVGKHFLYISLMLIPIKFYGWHKFICNMEKKKNLSK